MKAMSGIQVWGLVAALVIGCAASAYGDVLSEYFERRGFRLEERDAFREVEQEDLDLPEAPKPVGRLDVYLEILAEQADPGPFIKVRELRVSGNEALSEEILLRRLPVVFNADDTGAERPPHKTLYDFRPVHRLLAGESPVELSRKITEGLTKYLLSVYQSRGYSGIWVYVPNEQIQQIDGVYSVKDDVLEIVVIEARISDIQLTYHRKDKDPDATARFRQIDPDKGEKGNLRESVVREWSPVKSGDVTQERRIQEYLNLLNQNTDRYMSATLSKGADTQSVVVNYDIYELNPWHFYIESSNAGSKERRWNPKLGLVNTNIIGHDDRLTLIYQGPLQSKPLDPFDKNYSVFGSYSFPFFTPRLRFEIYAGHSNFDVSSDSIPGIFFLGSGDFYGARMRYNLFQFDKWMFDITSSISREESVNRPSIGLKSEVDINLWSVGFDICRNVEMATTSIGFTRSEKMGGSALEEFQKARLRAERDFSIYNVYASHSQFFDPEKIHRFRGWMHYVIPDEVMVPAKMISFGGLRTIRGYKENEFVADGGIMLSAQYEYDLVPGFNLFPEDNKQKPFLRRCALAPFFDYGRASNRDPVPGEEKTREMWSLGVGLLASLGNNFDAGIYYGIPMKKTPDTDRGDGRLSLSFLLYW